MTTKSATNTPVHRAVVSELARHFKGTNQYRREYKRYLRTYLSVPDAESRNEYAERVLMLKTNEVRR